MKAIENEKRDWSVIALILLFGLLFILLAGGWALRFTPRWELDANVESRLDPNSDFLTRRPSGFIEPVDPAILTNPAWIDVVLTPGASFSSAVTQPPATARTSFPTSTAGTLVTTQTALSTNTGIATNTALASPSPTNTFVYFPPPPTSTPKPDPAATSNPNPTATETATSTSTATASATLSPTSTSTATVTATASATPSQTFTATATSSTPTDTPTASATPTPTATSTFTPTPTFTNTPTNIPTSTSPSFCTTTITITGTSGSYTKPGGSTCFEYTDTFANGGIFQITSTGVNGTVDGSSCPGASISNGATINYGVTQSGGLMLFRITGTAGTVDINISDWTTYPTCP
ncbi:MAG TPA: hypothetical protein VFR47_18275 [Anaerolineales bacterium]|nr:hypothetical protein [Anaerolineales bacterium]